MRKQKNIRNTVGWATCLIAGLYVWSMDVTYGLGMGDIETQSMLNQPFEARIRLKDVNLDDIGRINVGLASRDRFKQFGLRYPPILQDMKISVMHGNQGSYIELESHTPVQETFLTLLVSLRYPGGSQIREYTVLLDPPLLMPKTAPKIAVAHKSSTQTRDVKPEPMRAITSTGVRRGDTLWYVAQRVRPDDSVTMTQVMKALYDANPEAFAGGSIHKIRAGYAMRVPEPETLKAVDAATARQWWRANTSSYSSSGFRVAVEQPVTIRPAANAEELERVQTETETIKDEPGTEKEQAEDEIVAEENQDAPWRLELVAPDDAVSGMDSSLSSGASLTSKETMNAESTELNRGNSSVGGVEQTEAAGSGQGSGETRVGSSSSQPSEKVSSLINFEEPQLGLQNSAIETETFSTKTQKRPDISSVYRVLILLSMLVSAVVLLIVIMRRRHAQEAFYGAIFPGHGYKVIAEDEGIIRSDAESGAERPSAKKKKTQPTTPDVGHAMDLSFKVMEGGGPEISRQAPPSILKAEAMASAEESNKTFNEKSVFPEHADQDYSAKPEADPGPVDTQTSDASRLESERMENRELSQSVESTDGTAQNKVSPRSEKFLNDIDFNMSFALYADALQLIEQGLADDPEWRELRFRRLEWARVSDDPELFMTDAHMLHDTAPAKDDEIWRLASHMGSQFLPDETLFKPKDGS